MKKKVSLFFFFLIASLLVVGTYSGTDVQASSQPIRLMIDGKIQNPDVPAQMKDNRTFVPIRFIAENLGAHVNWNKSQSRVEIIKDNTTIQLYVNSKNITVNGQAYQMDTTPYLSTGRTMVPVRFVSQYLGLEVGWQSAEKMVVISKPMAIFVNGNVLSSGYRPVQVHESVYVPTFELANQLNVAVKQTSDKKAYTFTYIESVETGIKRSHSIHVSEIYTVNGIMMTKIEHAKTLLGAQIQLDPNLQQYNVSKEITFVELSDISLEDGKYLISVPSLGESDIDYFYLQSPHRLVIDLPYTKIADTLKTTSILPLAHGTVDQVRLSQYSLSPTSVRIVFDLNKRSKVTINELLDKLELTIEERKPLVFIDAGHGGDDPGGVGSYSKEKDIALVISNKIVKLLEEDPEIDVVPTRSTDVFLTLEERTALANKAGADMFLSVHANAAGSSSVGGTETFVYYNADQTFGSIVHKHLIEATGLNDRGLKEAGFKVLRTSEMPAVLIEIAFISNPNEQKLLNDPAFQDKVAEAMYNAIREYEFGK